MRNAIPGAYVLLSTFQDDVGSPIKPVSSDPEGLGRGIPRPPDNGDEAALAAWGDANRDAVIRMAATTKAQYEAVGDWSAVVTAEMNALRAEWSAFKSQQPR